MKDNTFRKHVIQMLDDLKFIDQVEKLKIPMKLVLGKTERQEKSIRKKLFKQARSKDPIKRREARKTLLDEYNLKYIEY